LATAHDTEASARGAGDQEAQGSGGTPRYQVIWSDGGGRNGDQRSITVAREGEAKRLLAAIIATGNRLSDEYAHLARRRGAKAQTEVPSADPVDTTSIVTPVLTFAEYAARHVESLTGVGEGYRKEFRRDVERHMVPTFGGRPLAEVDEDIAKDWLRGLEVGTNNTYGHLLPDAADTPPPPSRPLWADRTAHAARGHRRAPLFAPVGRRRSSPTTC
jgi:hypothetical protein